MLNGMAIDNMVVGGPAYNSGKLEKGDQIIEVDHELVCLEDLQCKIIGADEPGSTVTITIRKANNSVLPVILQRVATEVIAHRRRMFEMFTILKVTRNVSVFFIGLEG